MAARNQIAMPGCLSMRKSNSTLSQNHVFIFSSFFFFFPVLVDMISSSWCFPIYKKTSIQLGCPRRAMHELPNKEVHIIGSKIPHRPSEASFARERRRVIDMTLARTYWALSPPNVNPSCWIEMALWDLTPSNGSWIRDHKPKESITRSILIEV